MRILVLNAGSSSLKGSVIELPGERTLASAEGTAGGQDRADAVPAVRALLDELGEAAREVDAVGHRVVHGGTRYRAPVLVDGSVLDALRELAPLAPLHNTVAAETIGAAMRLLDVPHVACFDTSFHAVLPQEAVIYPVPLAWYSDWGIRRYGFHGLSVAWSVRRAAELLGSAPHELRLVVAHLGSGCSVTAVEGGRSVDTSMGYTPLEGVMMATRPGSVDPGILLAALRDHGLGADELAETLEHRSGLRGLSGVDGGAREVEAAAAAGDERAALALGVFARRAAAGIAAAATALSALDALVFTGGIGANSTWLRRAIASRLAVLGLPRRLRDTTPDAVLAEGPPAVLAVTAREDVVIAGEAARALGAQGPYGRPV